MLQNIDAIEVMFVLLYYYITIFEFFDDILKKKIVKIKHRNKKSCLSFMPLISVIDQITFFCINEIPYLEHTKF